MALDESETIRSETRKRRRRRRRRAVPSPSRTGVGYRTSDSGEAARTTRAPRARPRGADSAEASRLRVMDAITRLELRRTSRDVGGPVVNRSELGAFLESLRESARPGAVEAKPLDPIQAMQVYGDNTGTAWSPETLEEAGFLDKPSGLSTTGSNLVRQVKELPFELGPAIARVARATASDVQAEFDPSEPDRQAEGPEWIFGRDEKAPPSRIYEDVVKPTAEGVKYLATPGPVIIGVGADGKPVYRAKDGGETHDPKKAKRGYAAKIEEGPLDYLLAALAIPTGGGSAVVQAGRLPLIGARFARHAQPGTRTLRTRTGEEVRQRTSRNPVTRAIQESTRATSTGLTGAAERLAGHELPVLGEHARAVRMAGKQTRRRERAEIGRATRPFEQAVRKLKGGEKIALVLRAQGVSPTELRRFVKERHAETTTTLAKARGKGDTGRARELRGELGDHERMLRLLGRTSDETYRRFESDPKLQAAYAEAGRLSEMTGDILEGLELLMPEARALRPYLTARVVGGARFERTPSQSARREHTREYRIGEKEVERPRTEAEAKTRLAALDKAYEDTLDGIVAQITGGVHDPGEQARRNLYNRRLTGKRKGITPMKTAKQEIRGMAEARLSQVLETRKDHPDVARVAALVEERRQLRETLSDPERHFGPGPATASPAGRRYLTEKEKTELRESLASFEVKDYSGLAHKDAMETALRRGYVYADEESGRGTSAAEFGTVTQTVPEKTIRRTFPERERRAASEGFVGGPSVEGLAASLHELITFPHTGRRLRPGQTPQKRSGAAPLRKPDITKRNRAVRLMASRWLPTPDAWRDAFVKAIAYAHARARGELAYSISRPLHSDGSTNRGWYYVRLDKAKPSRAARERSDLRRDMEEFIGDERDVDGYLRDTLVSKDRADVDRWLERAQAEGETPRIGQISPADYRALFGDFAPASAFVRRVFDRPTDFWRALTLTYRPAWVVNNLVGQTLLYALNHSSPSGVGFYAASVLDEARRSERYFPEELRQGFIRSEARQEGVPSGPPSLVRAGDAFATARNAERSMRESIQRLNAALSDNIPRRAAWYAVADEHRGLLDRIEGTNRTLDEFLEELRLVGENPNHPDTKLRQTHDDLVQEVLDELIDFGNMSVGERSVIRRLIPFYSWLKGITLATGRLAYEHPAKVLILSLLAQQGAAEGERRFGEGEEVLRGLLPVGEQDGDEQDFLSTRGLNPWATVGDVAGKITGAFSEDPDAQNNPALALNPLIQAGAETLFRRELFSGRELDAPGGQLGILGQQLLRSFPQADVIERSFMQEPTSGALTVPGARFGGVPAPILGYLGAPLTRKNIAKAQEYATDQPSFAEDRHKEHGADLARAKKLAKFYGEPLPDDYQQLLQRDLLFDLARDDLKENLDVEKLTEAQEVGVLISILFAQVPESVETQDELLSEYEARRGDPLDLPREGRTPSGRMHDLRLWLEDQLGFNQLGSYNSFLNRIEDQMQAASGG